MHSKTVIYNYFTHKPQFRNAICSVFKELKYGFKNHGNLVTILNLKTTFEQ